MNNTAQILKLQDEAREHQAIALGKKIEIAMLKNQHKAAEQYRRQLDGINALRVVAKSADAEKHAACYFATVGGQESA